MTVKDLKKRLDLFPNEMIVLWSEDLKGWDNIDIQVVKNTLYILPDKKPLFND